MPAPITNSKGFDAVVGAAFAAIDSLGGDSNLAARRVFRALFRRVAAALGRRYPGDRDDTLVVDFPTLNYAAVTPLMLSALYEAVLARGARGRKAAGAFYTPPALVERIIEGALDPVLRKARRAPLVCDPACGAGHFLLAAANRMTDRGMPADLIASGIRGADIDPTAVEICRFSLWLALGASLDPLVFEDAIRCGDSLCGDPCLLGGDPFDAVIGNPPFINGIEGGSDAATRALLRQRWPDMTGTIDLSSEFLRMSADLVRPGGRVGLILPISALSNRSLAAFRANPPGHLRPNLIYAPGRSSAFASACVYVCCLVLGPDPDCRVATGEKSFRSSRISGANWWDALAGPMPESPDEAQLAPTLGEAFEVTASMTVGDAYHALAHIRDDEDGAGARLITTGLIDREQCHWGHRPCRFLGHTYAAPHLPSTAALPPSLARRVAKSTRPKVLVAGLTRKIEAFLDARGQCIGAVSTFSVYHPGDDIAALDRLCRHLHSSQTHALYLARLGAHRVGGGDITMRKDFLKGLDLAGM